VSRRAAQSAALLALSLALAAPAAAAATDGRPPAALAEAGARVAAASAALAAAQGDAERIEALAAATSAYEAGLAALRTTVIGAEARERALSFDLARRRAEIAELAFALQSLGRGPSPALALHPQGPLGAARAASTLAWVTPRLQEEADAVSAQLGEIEAARALRARGLADVEAGLETLAAARAAIADALAARAPAPEASAAAAALARDAETLSELADRLAVLGGGAIAGVAPSAGAGTSAAGAPLALRWPVVGHVLRGFREPDAAGVRRPGLVLEAPPLSLVTAPADARVRYAGPFLDYGYVVVLEPRADVLVVVAGLATIETRAGEFVRQGALLGLLGGRQLDAQEYVMLGLGGTGETKGETLYIEVRHREGPVDPASWFGDGNG